MAFGLNAWAKARTKGIAQYQVEHDGEAKPRLTSGGRAGGTDIDTTHPLSQVVLTDSRYSTKPSRGIS